MNLNLFLCTFRRKSDRQVTKKRGKDFLSSNVTFCRRKRLKGIMDEKELNIISSVLAGKTERFSYFLDTYGQRVFNLIVRMTGSPEDAEELTQDTFMKAFEHLSAFNGNSSFSTWIYRIAYNTTLSALRKKRNEVLSFDDKLWKSVSDTQVDEALDTDSEEQIEKLQQALSTLPADEQALVTLFYEEEKTISEICYILHLSESNAKVKLHRIRKKLYLLMTKED